MADELQLDSGDRTYRFVSVIQNRDVQTVCVVGLGYIGLPTAAILADTGYDVHGMDISDHVVRSVNSGRLHFHEPQLDEIVRRNVERGTLRAGPRPTPADVFVICVPTPLAHDNRPDLSFVEQAARSIRPMVTRNSLILLESTCPPGTTESIAVRLAVPSDFTVGKDVFVAYCPERVIPGKTVEEVSRNDRVVGGVTPHCTKRAKEFFESFVQGQVFCTDALTAELTKLSENAYRDVNIAFANELSMLVTTWGADAREVIRLANRHPRVDILSPGPGVGGHCISVDPWFLVDGAQDQTRLIQAARTVNDQKPYFVVDQVRSLCRAEGISIVGCLGLAYKANVDDFRESPSLVVVRELMKDPDLQVVTCEPHVNGDRFEEIELVDLETVLQVSQLLVLLTDHDQFRALGADQLCGKQTFDTRGMWADRPVNRPAPSPHAPVGVGHDLGSCHAA